MRFQCHDHLIHHVFFQNAFQLFISSQTLAQFRALNLADVPVHSKTHMRARLYILHILVCKMAVAYHNNMLLVIAKLAVMPQNGTHANAF